MKSCGAELRRVLVLGVHKLIIKINGKEQLRLASPSWDGLADTVSPAHQLLTHVFKLVYCLQIAFDFLAHLIYLLLAHLLSSVINRRLKADNLLPGLWMTYTPLIKLGKSFFLCDVFDWRKLLVLLFLVIRIFNLAINATKTVAS